MYPETALAAMIPRNKGVMKLEEMIGGMNYYRIKAVHENGNKTYSKIISIKTYNNGPISISNTNVPGIFLVKSGKVYSAPYLAYNILNSSGIVVHKGRIENAHGKINTTMNLSFLQNGIYYVSFNTEDKLPASKIVLSR